MSLNINTTVKENEKDLINNYINTFSNSIFNFSTTSITEDTVTGITYNPNNGFMVAIVNGGVTNNFIYSNDGGFNWTYYTKSSIGDSWRSITYGNGIYVAVGNSQIATSSTDPTSGSSWTNNASPIVGNWFKVIFFAGVFLAFSDSGTNKLIRSTDGINWTILNIFSSSEYILDIEYGNGVFVAHTTKPVKGNIWYSFNNTNSWIVSDTSAAFTDSYKLVYSWKLKNFFLIYNTNLFYSSNGNSWSSVNISNTIQNTDVSTIFKIIWVDELQIFVAFCNNSSNKFITLTSFNAINWTTNYIDSNYRNFTSLIWNKHFGILIGISKYVSSPSSTSTFYISKKLGKKHLLDSINYNLNSIEEEFNYFEYNINNLNVSKNYFFSIYPILNIQNNYIEYSIDPSLPSGVTINSYNGVISGSYSGLETNTLTYSIYAKNLLNNKKLKTKIKITFSNQSESISIFYYYTQTSEIFINTNNLNYYPFIVGSYPITYSTSSTLPPGLSLNSNNGIISGNILIPNTPQTYNITIVADNLISSKSAIITLIIKDRPIQPFRYNLGNDIIREASEPLSILPYLSSSTSPLLSNTGTNIVYSISPTFSVSNYPNLTFNASTGLISGTVYPSYRNVQFTITATNGTSTGGVSTNLRIITNDVPPTGLSYGTTGIVTEGGTTITPVTPTLSSGTNITFSISPPLPSALSLNISTGTISGSTQSASITTNHIITATNTNGVSTSTTFSIRNVRKSFTIVSGYGTSSYSVVNGHTNGSYVAYGTSTLGSISNSSWMGFIIGSMTHVYFTYTGDQFVELTFFGDTSTLVYYRDNPTAFFNRITIYRGDPISGNLVFGAFSYTANRSIDQSYNITGLWMRWTSSNVFTNGQTHTILIE